MVNKVKIIPTIKAGDYVDIKFVGDVVMMKNCLVLYTPDTLDTSGGWWSVLDTGGHIRYVQNFEEIVRKLTEDEKKNGVTNQRIG